MSLKILQVDAFTNRPFAGNPAAVCVMDTPIEADLMQAIAAEMNLSETAFLWPLEGATEGGYSLRWFTPATEVDLCGHATLASAHVLWSEGYLKPEETARFSTKSGWLSAAKKEDWIELDFPAQPVTVTSYVAPALIKSLCCGGNIRTVAKNEVNYLIELQSETVLRSLEPDFAQIKKLPLHGIIVTAPADSDEYDFVSRYFAPAVGINEDPVTGSAHTSLAPYWQEKLGKSNMLAQQLSARGGIIRVHCKLPNSNTAPTDSENRILISGQAITILQGDLMIR
ncbi:PhzF family phenazine biosynthesis protein [cf. Phormidesmis sp. LEGE 11477]|uniref:PhzF family phenazine biosynthesis protein n=1 Tax=cf. Phormidesmis sp. LEGE 11477 TaxID=1828680 RepID=UPI00188157F9|nr:PhzF family phenazine biosynthesis protein [cf. Phormidesmis sp. LEGE 11477]MBE9061909.1 PhzF family phenazine biosynthesis protein [cf. Phormidesmis sp. LEGE 11477]